MPKSPHATTRSPRTMSRSPRTMSRSPRTLARTTRGAGASPRWRGWPAIVFGGLAVAGLFAGELKEILINATILCLSCMGLGK